MTMPMMSLVMLMNGPVARAGSIFSFSSVNGTNVPNIDAKITTENNDTDTAMVVTRPGSSRKKQLYKNTSREIIEAFISPTPSSLPICLAACFISRLPLARPCTTIADDCMPTLPPVPPISGINSAMAGLVANPFSKLPSITELASPPIMPISSHGRRALVCVSRLSLVSTSVEIPDAN